MPFSDDVQQLTGQSMEAAGVPAELLDGIFAGISAAGYSIVPAASSTPLMTVDATPGERVRIMGMRGTFLAGARVGERGWLVWIERIVGDAIERTPPSFIAGAGILLKRALHTGRWTVGTSAVGGSDTIK